MVYDQKYAQENVHRCTNYWTFELKGGSFFREKDKTITPASHRTRGKSLAILEDLATLATQQAIVAEMDTN